MALEIVLSLELFDTLQPRHLSNQQFDQKGGQLLLQIFKLNQLVRHFALLMSEERQQGQ